MQNIAKVSPFSKLLEMGHLEGFFPMRGWLANKRKSSLLRGDNGGV